MRIVIPDDYGEEFGGHVRHLDAFRLLDGHDVVIFHDTVVDEDALAARFADADAIVLIRERTPITASLLARLPRLRVVAQTGRAGAHVDAAACKARGVTVLEGKGSPVAPAELTWALIMASARRIVFEHNALASSSSSSSSSSSLSQRAATWQASSSLGMALKGRTLGIWGYGRIGSLVAQYGLAFGMKVLACVRREPQQATMPPGAPVSISFTRDARELFAESDVVTLHLKLTPETRGIVTEALLSSMKPTASFVNTSRAALIEAGALERALDRGRPGAAALDVHDVEPSSPPLARRPNVICTPHLGYVEKDSYEMYFGEAFQNLIAWAASSS